MGTHLRVLSESYPMNTNMIGFRWFSSFLRPYALDESALSIGRSSIVDSYLSTSYQGMECTYHILKEINLANPLRYA